MIGKQGRPNITSATMIQIIQANEALKRVQRGATELQRKRGEPWVGEGR